MFKRTSSIFLLLIMLLSLFACKKANIDETREFPYETAPYYGVPSEDYNLDFNDMNNYVIDYLNSENMPFFFVKSNKDGILSGDNEKKLITITCECTKGTTVHDLDLFLSMALNGIGFNAAEQDNRFKRPTVDSTGTFTDFGSVFNVYSLKIDAKNEDGEVLRNDLINATERIPIEPRYIKE